MYLTPSSLLLIPQINSRLVSTKPAAYLPYAVTLIPSVFDISELNYLLIFMHSCLIPPEVRSDYTFAPSNPIVYTMFATPPTNHALTIPMTMMDAQTVESGMYILIDCLTWLTIACPDCRISGERCSSSEGPSDVEARQGLLPQDTPTAPLVAHDEDSDSGAETEEDPSLEIIEVNNPKMKPQPLHRSKSPLVNFHQTSDLNATF